jgi:dihydrofolate reductase
MRKIILDLAVTLDGFIEGRNGEVDWCILDEDMNADAFLRSIDIIFYGRVSYDLWGTYQPGEKASASEKKLWADVHAKEKYVFSRQARQDKRATYISSDLVQRVQEIKTQAGKDIWLYGGASLITSFLNHQLIDVFRMAVHPTVPGAGKPLFANVKRRLALRLTDTRVFRSGVVQSVYERT